MAPLTVAVTGDFSIDKGATTDLVITSSAGTVKSVAWTVATEDEGLVTVTPDAADTTGKKAAVKGIADGIADITATVTVEVCILPFDSVTGILCTL